MKRANDNKYGYRSWTEEDIKRFARFLVLPLLVLILVIVILIVDRKNHPKPEETVLETESSSAAEADSGETEESSQQEFTVGSVPEVEALVNQYFAAKQNADAEGIYQMFGWTDTAGIDELRRSCSMMPGIRRAIGTLSAIPAREPRKALTWCTLLTI